MRIFLCAGEPSGDLHGANLIRALGQRCPEAEFVGFGGDKMAAAGCRLLYPLCQLAIMGFFKVLTQAATFLKLLSRADRYFRRHRPDAVVLIDYPGFNWWLARRAHFHGLPVFYFVPPQLWGWAGWRIRKMQRWVDHVLCNLPFEKPWYESRGVPAHYVGHPYFDELPRQELDPSFLADQRRQGGDIVALLPGSRTQEVQRNLSTLVRSAAAVHARRPGTHFLVACFQTAHQQRIDSYLRKHPGLPIQTWVGKTPEIIELSRACVAVSGSVALELFYRGKPSVMVYRIGRLERRLARWLMTCPYITLVNLLAQKELFPEFLSDRCEAQAIAEIVLRWLSDPGAHGKVRAELSALRQRVALPGACARTADYILTTLGRRRLERFPLVPKLRLGTHRLRNFD